MTVFRELEFSVSDIRECVKDGNVVGRGGAGIVYPGKMPKHRNMVRLLAFCSNKETNLLVYEYMRNGSLGKVLHGKKGELLGWNLRDVKSNNILLNSAFEAHIADFGLAKFLIDAVHRNVCQQLQGRMHQGERRFGEW
ncbi:hypothetical protein WN943_006132 [Citrus x changshan-huyou]